jgi:diadenylate cyclase
MTPDQHTDTRLQEALALMAPGTPLRDGLERILQGRTGALIVIGWDRSIEQITNGGFVLDVPFSATRLRELAKMDGAIVIDRERQAIVRAGVQLVPDPSLPTDETGTRHRTADRVSRQTRHPVISVSKSMNTIAVYVDGRHHLLEESTRVMARASQAVATLEGYKDRLDEVDASLSSLEIEDTATLRDVCLVAQRLEMVVRIRDEIDAQLLMLGTDGRLLALQVHELIRGVETSRRLLVRDYLAPALYRRRRAVDRTLEALGQRPDPVDLTTIAAALGQPDGADALESPVTPRGFRLLARVPRLPEVITDRIVGHFGTLPRLLAASTEDLQRVEGVGETRARSVRDGLSRLAEASLLERYG